MKIIYENSIDKLPENIRRFISASDYNIKQFISESNHEWKCPKCDDYLNGVQIDVSFESKNNNVKIIVECDKCHFRVIMHATIFGIAWNDEGLK